MTFAGFDRTSRRFFADLAENNNRPWFLAHKAEYEQSLKAPMMALIVDLAGEFARRDIPLSIDDPAKALSQTSGCETNQRVQGYAGAQTMLKDADYNIESPLLILLIPRVDPLPSVRSHPSSRS